MALHENLEDLLKHMSEADAKAQRETWEKNPALAKVLADGVMRQSEFNRQLNLKDEEVQKSKTYADKWKDWSDKHVPVFNEMKTDYEKIKAERDELNEKIKSGAIRASDESGTTVTAAELEDRVAKRLEGRSVSDAQLKTVIEQEAAKIILKTEEVMANARKEFLEQTFPAATQFGAELTEVQLDYRAEYGKPLDRKAFSDFMREKKIIDPRMAYNEFTAKDRYEKQVKTEVDKRVQEELAKKFVPGVSGAEGRPHDALGTLELKIAGETPKFAEGSRLGDKSAANMAAAELMAGT